MVHPGGVSRLRMPARLPGMLTAGSTDNRAIWHHYTSGSGPTLILLHGIGMSHAVWRPVIPYLCATRRIVVFDTAGFGATPPLANGALPTIAHLVDALEVCLAAIGITNPVDIAGNSLGGAMALEAARRGLARTVVAISPAGLWANHGARHVPFVFGALRYGATHFPRLLKRAMGYALFRELALAVPLSVGSGTMPPRDAVGAVDDLARSTAFEATFNSTRTPFSATRVTAPVTVAFGSRDWILPEGSRNRDQLPPQTKWVVKARWGHVPMWVDPAGVAELILNGTR
jgi:pimeloyl-ACP methyl ester carboxylesterase